MKTAPILPAATSAPAVGGGGVRDLAVVVSFKFQQVEEDFVHSNLIAVLDPARKVIHRSEALNADITPIVQAVQKLLQN